MSDKLDKHFEKIGADIVVTHHSRKPVGFGRRWTGSGFEAATENPIAIMDIRTVKGKEVYVLSLRRDTNIEANVVEVRPEDRHLLLLVRSTNEFGHTDNKEHFLCGHDERHFFVAGVKGVSTVNEAKDQLKPREILSKETGKASKRNRRKTENFIRQGEWFFVPVEDPELDTLPIHKDEPISRGRGSKDHVVSELVRKGGTKLNICSRFPDGLTDTQKEEAIAKNPNLAHLAWRTGVADAKVYARGEVKHSDHATITLKGWHRVYMNRETFRKSVRFID